MRSPPVGLPALVAGALVLAAPAAARAYTFESPISRGCHEEITTRALRTTRLEGLSPTLAPDAEERALIDDVPFHVEPDLRDLAGTTLLLAVRDNDLDGKGISDLDSLAAIHGDPATQEKHCLRAPGDDGDGGSAAALARCRAFIRARAIEALDGLDVAGLPRADRRVALPVTLAMRGAVSPTLPLYWVRIGQAAHALQDSFTHTYRTADAYQVTVVLNWIDDVDGVLDERRDGPPHLSAMDRCAQQDDLRALRERRAEDATTELLRATLGPADRGTKLAAIDAVLDRYAGFAPGCSFDDHWCDAKEPVLAESQGCAAGGAGIAGGAGAGVLTALGLIAALAVVRRRRRGGARALAGSGVLAGLLVAASPARAEVQSASEAERYGTRSRLGVVAAAGGAVDHAALAVSLGGRYRVHDAWLVGLDAEWNPWASFVTDRVRPGALNVYATAVRRWPMLADRVDLRTTAHLGVSRILFDLYGVPQGTTGLFVGVSFLGLELRTSRSTSVLIEPAHVMVPIPQLHGAPYAYVQYRFTVGLQFGG
jgi:hypothetical protein